MLIEAFPGTFQELVRTPRSPKSHKINSAVCEQRVGGTIKVNAVLGRCRVNCTTTVPCEPLPAIMTRAGMPHVNFLSLDVEGQEETVLRTSIGTDGQLPFDIVLVECERHTPAKNARVRTLLRDAGLQQLPLRYAPGSFNDLWVRPQLGDPRRSWKDAAAAAERDKGWLLPLLDKWPRSDDPYRRIMSPNAFATRVLQGFPSSLMDHLEAFPDSDRISRSAWVLGG